MTAPDPATRYLVSMAFGPVQEFIAAARRTADLYAGSKLLAEVVGAAATAFTDDERIFPLNPKSGGANKILAITTRCPAEVTQAAKQNAAEKLKEVWASVWSQLGAARTDVDEPRAMAQLEDFLEMYAAWVPLKDDAAYGAQRNRVERLLAGRKALRDFQQAPGDDVGLSKSPLDPGRATVLLEKAERGVSPLYLKNTEYLDAISVLKRVRGGDLREDGRALLDTRDLAQRALNPDFRSHPEEEFTPGFAYYAVLVADGDLMGQLLSAKDTPGDHRAVSGQLDIFAAQAKRIVQRHKGLSVYTGGDDVLALLPATRALACAQALSQAFRAALQDGATLSVGLALCHYLEPLSVALEHGRAAERAAKVKRNSVALSLHTRGGSPVTVSQPWPEFTLTRWVEFASEGKLPRGVPYELRDLALEWPKPEEGRSAEDTALTAEVNRILQRKRARDGVTPQRIATDTAQGPALPTLRGRDDLLQFAHVLTLARFLSREELQEQGGRQATGGHA